jgi:WD40 repeat protein
MNHVTFITRDDTMYTVNAASLRVLLQQHMNTKRWNGKIAKIGFEIGTSIVNTTSDPQTNVIVEHGLIVTFGAPQIVELPNGNLASSRSKEIHIYDHMTLKQIRVLQVPQNILALCVLHNGLLACGGEESMYYLWNVESGEQVGEKRYGKPEDVVIAITQLHDQTIVLNLGFSKLFVINLEGDVISEIDVAWQVLSIYEVRPGIVLFSCGENNVCKLFDIKTRTVLQTLQV